MLYKTTYWAGLVNTKEETTNNNYVYINMYWHLLNNDGINGCYFIGKIEEELCYSYVCITPSINLNILDCRTGEKFTLIKNENYGFYTSNFFRSYFKIF